MNAAASRNNQDMQHGLWGRLIGHHAVVARCQTALRNGRLAQGYLLAGPPGVGKRLFATCLAQSLLCERRPADELTACGACGGCRQVAAGTHPDLLTVELPPDKSEIPVDLLLGAGERRGREGLLHDLSLRAMAGDRRIAVIDDVDKLNASGANALLKTLEEPPPGVVMLLISPQPDSLLPTIRSRCQLISFGLLTPGELSLVLEQMRASDQLPLEVPQPVPAGVLSCGSVPLALEQLEPGTETLRTTVADVLSLAPVNWVDAEARLTEVLDELRKAGGDERRLAERLFQLSREFFRDVRHARCGQLTPTAATARLMSALPADEAEALELLAELEECALTALEHLDRKTAWSLCLQQFLASVSRREQIAQAQAQARS